MPPASPVSRTYTPIMRKSGIVADGPRRLAAGEAAEATGEQPRPTLIARLLAALMLGGGRPDQRLWFRR
jgi:hypothetical protein